MSSTPASHQQVTPPRHNTTHQQHPQQNTSFFSPSFVVQTPPTPTSALYARSISRCIPPRSPYSRFTPLHQPSTSSSSYIISKTLKLCRLPPDICQLVENLGPISDQLLLPRLKIMARSIQSIESHCHPIEWRDICETRDSFVRLSTVHLQAGLAVYDDENLALPPFALSLFRQFLNLTKSIELRVATTPLDLSQSGSGNIFQNSFPYGSNNTGNKRNTTLSKTTTTTTLAVANSATTTSAIAANDPSIQQPTPKLSTIIPPITPPVTTSFIINDDCDVSHHTSAERMKRGGQTADRQRKSLKIGGRGGEDGGDCDDVNNTGLLNTSKKAKFNKSPMNDKSGVDKKKVNNNDSEINKCNLSHSHSSGSQQSEDPNTSQTTVTSNSNSTSENNLVTRYNKIVKARCIQLLCKRLNDSIDVLNPNNNTHISSKRSAVKVPPRDIYIYPKPYESGEFTSVKSRLRKLSKAIISSEELPACSSSSSSLFFSSSSSQLSQTSSSSPCTRAQKVKLYTYSSLVKRRSQKILGDMWRVMGCIDAPSSRRRTEEGSSGRQGEEKTRRRVTSSLEHRVQGDEGYRVCEARLGGGGGSSRSGSSDSGSIGSYCNRSSIVLASNSTFQYKENVDSIVPYTSHTPNVQVPCRNSSMSTSYTTDGIGTSINSDNNQLTQYASYTRSSLFQTSSGLEGYRYSIDDPSNVSSSCQLLKSLSLQDKLDTEMKSRKKEKLRREEEERRKLDEEILKDPQRHQRGRAKDNNIYITEGGEVMTKKQKLENRAIGAMELMGAKSSKKGRYVSRKAVSGRTKRTKDKKARLMAARTSERGHENEEEEGSVQKEMEERVEGQQKKGGGGKEEEDEKNEFRNDEEGESLNNTCGSDDRLNIEEEEEEGCPKWKDDNDNSVGAENGGRDSYAGNWSNDHKGDDKERGNGRDIGGGNDDCQMKHKAGDNSHNYEGGEGEILAGCAQKEENKGEMDACDGE